MVTLKALQKTEPKLRKWWKIFKSELHPYSHSEIRKFYSWSIDCVDESELKTRKRCAKASSWELVSLQGVRTEGESGKMKSYTLSGLLFSCIKFSPSVASRHICQNVIQDTAASISLSETHTQKHIALINASGQVGSQDDVCCSRDITLANMLKSRKAEASCLVTTNSLSKKCFAPPLSRLLDRARVLQVLNLEFSISGAPLGKFWVFQESQIFQKISGLFHFWMIKWNATPSNLEALWEIWFVNMILRNSFSFFS